MSTTTIWIAAAVVGIIILRRVSRIVGGIFAVLVTMGVAFWGYWVYSHDGGLAFAGVALPQTAFYAIVAAWFGLELFGVVQHLRKRKTAKDDADEIVGTGLGESLDQVVGLFRFSVIAYKLIARLC